MLQSRVYGGTASCRLLALICISIGAIVNIDSVDANEPAFGDLLQRLKRTEQELWQTRDEIETLRRRDQQRQSRQRSLEEQLRGTNSLYEPSYINSPEPSGEVETLGSFTNGEPFAGTKGSQSEVQQKMEEFGSSVENLAKNLRVTTLDENIKIGIFGWLRGEMLLSDRNPIIHQAPFFLGPFAGADQQQVSVHGRSTTIGAAVEGPRICGYETGGLVLISFFGNSVLSNSSGVFFAQGYGELKSDMDRLAFGLQADIIGPRNPTVLNWGVYAGAGNTGFLRGQIRYERYFKPSHDRMWTVTVGLSDPAPTNLAAALPEVAFAGSNGWPNVEGRIGLGLGCEYQEGMEKRRPFELGVSGFIGEIRTNVPALVASPVPPGPPVVPSITNIVDETWYIGMDVRVAFTHRFGFQAELFRGKGLGTYGGGIMQTINTVTFQTIDSEGGWGEVYFYWHPCLHSHFGYAIDDPHDEDVGGPGERTKNQVVFGNLIWDVTKNFQIGFEVSHWRTEYAPQAPPLTNLFQNNEGTVYHLRMQYAF